MTNFDKEKVNDILESYGFGKIENIVKGGRDGAYSTVFGLTPKLNSSEKVLKLYKRGIGSSQLLKDEFNAMKKAFEASDTFPEPYAYITFEGCADPRFNQMKETLYGIVLEKFEPVYFKNTPSEADVLKFAKDILEELVVLHKISGFRHGDIKLSNVLMCPRKNKYSLIDFNTSDTRFSADSTITAYSLQGSRYYVDPQTLINNEPGKYSYSPKSDIYALGMTLRLLLNDNKQEYSFESEPTAEQLINAKRRLGVFKSRKYSKEVCELVSKATAFERYDRFDSAESMLDAINFMIDKSNLITAETVMYETNCEEKTYVPDYDTTSSSSSIQNVTITGTDMSKYKRNSIIKAIRCGDYQGALTILSKTNDRYTNFLKGCAYLGKKDMRSAENSFNQGKDKMSYYMLYIMNMEKSPEYAYECLKTAAQMSSPPAMFVYGHKLYKSSDKTSRSEGLQLIIRAAEAKCWDAYRYLCKLHKRGEISTNLIHNIDTSGLTNTLSSFAN